MRPLSNWMSSFWCKNPTFGKHLAIHIADYCCLDCYIETIDFDEDHAWVCCMNLSGDDQLANIEKMAETMQQTFGVPVRISVYTKKAVILSSDVKED